MNKYYDKDNKRLVFVGRVPNKTFWDTHWESTNFEKYIRRIDHFVRYYTRSIFTGEQE